MTSCKLYHFSGNQFLFFSRYASLRRRTSSGSGVACLALASGSPPTRLPIPGISDWSAGDVIVRLGGVAVAWTGEMVVAWLGCLFSTLDFGVDVAAEDGDLVDGEAVNEVFSGVAGELGTSDAFGFGKELEAVVVTGSAKESIFALYYNSFISRHLATKNIS